MATLTIILLGLAYVWLIALAISLIVYRRDRKALRVDYQATTHRFVQALLRKKAEALGLPSDTTAPATVAGTTPRDSAMAAANEAQAKTVGTFNAYAATLTADLTRVQGQAKTTRKRARLRTAAVVIPALIVNLAVLTVLQQGLRSAQLGNWLAVSGNWLYVPEVLASGVMIGASFIGRHLARQSGASLHYAQPELQPLDDELHIYAHKLARQLRVHQWLQLGGELTLSAMLLTLTAWLLELLQSAYLF